MFSYKEIAMPSDSVAIDLHEVQTLFQAIDHYLVAQESRGPDAPELESADLGTEFADFATPLRDHYAQLHADQVAHVAALRAAWARAGAAGGGGSRRCRASGSTAVCGP